MAEDEATAMRRFEDVNDVQQVDDVDQVFTFDEEQQRDQMRSEPWLSNPTHFKNTRISAMALLKMVTHAKSGGRLEVMGILQGKLDGDTIVVMDCFALPVQGTETRVNAGQAEYAFMVQYAELCSQMGRLENVIGWYHSHPGYGCWLSGIDVATQLLNQQHQDPWLAVVVDPVRTQVSGKVELGAFRCYPKGQEPSRGKEAEHYQSIPLDKIEDFGVHANAYYPLEVSYFRSRLDSRILESLWHQYWVNTLSSSAVTSNEGYANQQLSDIARKMKAHASKGMHTGRMRRFLSDKGDREAKDLEKTSMDGTKAAIEMSSALTAEILKSKVFMGKLA